MVPLYHTQSMIHMPTSPNNPTQTRIAPTMQEPLVTLSETIAHIMGDTLLGLTAYGPVLGPDFDDTRMTAQSVLVVHRVEIERLKALAARGTSLGKLNISSPLVLTESFITDSTDTFPLELLEIQQRRHTLLGRDCFANIDLHAEHIRLQCEREFKRIQLRMRQGLLASTAQTDALDALQTDVAAHLLRTMRGLLWLHGSKTFVPQQDVVSACESMLRLTLPGLRSALQHYMEHGWSDFQALYDDVEHLVAAADRW